MTTAVRLPLCAALFLPLLIAACAGAGDSPPESNDAVPAASVPDSSAIVHSIAGLAGPEAVRYDPEQDVYFVSSFGEAGGDDRDGNGFISRIGPEGTVESLRFMTGTAAAPLHMPRGMILRGDTLWVADVDGVHGFDRRTGAHVGFVDFTMHSPGFLNDLALDAEGTLYVTDTGGSRVYRVREGRAEIAVDDTLTGQPNGITWDGAQRRFVLATWGDRRTLRAWDPVAGTVVETDSLPGGRYDGIEVVNGEILVASQRDSTIYAIRDGNVRPLLRVPGAPADIGVDTRRQRIAVPYVARNRVDIWAIPARVGG
jgi:sugar lactone lactonase YvrE